MERGLLKVILVDSYLAGRVAEVEVTGHTSINGENGAGKTALLQLIPIFYGSAPRSFVTKTAAGRLSFVDWYLKREGSCLVFEYLAGVGQKRMAVFRRLPGQQGPQQVLIDSPYDVSLFVDYQNNLVHPTSGLAGRLRARDIDYWICGSLQEYRQILMDGTHRSKTKFSLAGRNARLGAMVPLISSILKREVSFDDVAVVIQDHVRQRLSEEALDKLKHFKPNKQGLQRAVRVQEAYSAAEALKPSVPELIDVLAQYKSGEKKLAAAREAAAELDDALSKEITLKQGELTAAKEKKADQEREHEATVANLDDAIQRTLRELEPVKDELDGLNRRLRRYQDQEAPAKARQVAELLDAESVLATRKDELERLKSNLENLEGPVRRAKEEELRRWDQYQVRATEEWAQMEAEHRATEDNLRAERRRAEEALSNQHREEINELDEGIHRQDKEQHRWERESDNPTIDKKLDRKLREADELQRHAQSELNGLSSEREKALSRREMAAHAQNSASRDLDQAVKVLDDAEEEHRLVGELVNGTAGSLIRFLETQRPGWTETLGKVFDLSLLRRTDLSPTLSTLADPDAFAGVQLDLSALPSRDLTPEALRKREELALAGLKDAEKAYNEASSALERASKERDHADKESRRRASEARHAEKELAERNQTLSTARREVDEARRAAKEVAEEALEQATRALEELKGRRTSLLQDHAAALEAHKAETEQAIQALRADHERQREAARRDRETSKARHESTLSRLDSQLTDIQTKNGIDPAQVKALESEIEGLKDTIETLRRYRDLAEDYRSFMEDEHPKIAGLKETVEGMQAELKAKRTQRGRVEADCTQALKHVTEEISGLTDTVDRHSRDQRRLRGDLVYSHWGIMGGAVEGNEHLPLFRSMEVGQLIADYSSLLQANQRRQEGLRQMNRRFSETFLRHPDTPVSDYWHSIKSYRSGMDEPVITEAESIREYYESGNHDQIRATAIGHFNALHEVDLFQQAMEGFERNVASFSRQLAGHLGEKWPFRLVQSAKPTITLQLEKLAFWEDTKRLSKEIRKWSEPRERDLPSEALLSALRVYINAVPDDSASLDEFWRLINFRFDIETDKGPRTAHKASQLPDVSSNAGSYLVLIMLLLAFMNMLRGHHPVHMVWALDELGDIDSGNTHALLKLLAENRISLVTATPKLDSGQLSLFGQAYEVISRGGKGKLVRWTSSQTGDLRGENPFLKPAETIA